MDPLTPPVAHDVVTASIDYDLDVATAQRVAQHLGEIVGRGSRVVLDMGGVEFLDCAGLSQILAAHRRAAAGGGWVRLTSLRKGPRRVLELTRTADVLCAPGDPGGAADLGC